jgi:outer membrane immunogenic protein
MKRIVVGAVGLLAWGAAAPAVAADLPAQPYTKAPAMIAAIYDWSGFYVGINGGGGSAHKCWNLAQSAAFGVFTPLLNEGCHNATGGTVGGQIGYRWQSGAFVFGMEGQGNWANFKGSNLNLLAGGGFIPVGLTDQSKVNGFGLLTAQVGYAWNNVLWYAKGGAAVANQNWTLFNGATGVGLFQADRTRWGGTVGTGIEYGFAPNWSVALEYDYLWRVSNTNTYVIPAGVLTARGLAGSVTSFNANTRADVNMITARINYHFNAFGGY